VGRGPKDTCLRRWSQALLPSKAGARMRGCGAARVPGFDGAEGGFDWSAMVSPGLLSVEAAPRQASARRATVRRSAAPFLILEALHPRTRAPSHPRTFILASPTAHSRAACCRCRPASAARSSDQDRAASLPTAPPTPMCVESRTAPGTSSPGIPSPDR
jgi:hypothetical protein